MKYVIVVEPYRENSGGIAVLHNLGKKLKEKGCEVYIISPHGPGRTLPGLNLIDKNYFDTINEDSWVIYPEIRMGNPLNAKNVIRWVLNTPGFIGGSTNTWSDTDLVYTIADYWHIDPKIKVEGYLKVWDFKLDFWEDLGLDRDLNLHLIRKASGRPGSKQITFDKHEDSSIQIDGKIADNFTILKEFLNKTNKFISYDTGTFYSCIAALCGATSIVIPDGVHTKEEYKNKFPLCKFGVAWGLDDIQWAIDTKDKVRPHLKEMEKEADDLIDAFIERTQK